MQMKETGLQLADKIKIYNACGKFGLNESADLVRRAKLVVTNDTGLMHIAAAYKRPVISLWGNTVPEFGMYPYYGSNFLRVTGADKNELPYDIMEIKNLRCRPCSKIGYDSCPLGHFKCMEKIDPASVVAQIRARLVDLFDMLTRPGAALYQKYYNRSRNQNINNFHPIFLSRQND